MKNSSNRIAFFTAMAALLCMCLIANIVRTTVYAGAAAVDQVKESEGYKAFLMYADGQWNWSNFEVNKSNGGAGNGNDANIIGDGTYTVSLDKTTMGEDNVAQGVTVFCVDIVGLANAQRLDASKLKVKDVIIQCDGKKIASDGLHMFVGDLEGNGNIRIEIYNTYGYGEGEFKTSENPGFNVDDLNFSESLAVTFTLEGLKVGKTPEGVFAGNDEKYVQTVKGKTEGEIITPSPIAASTVAPTEIIETTSVPIITVAPTAIPLEVPAASPHSETDNTISKLSAKQEYVKSGYRYQKYVELTWKQGESVAGFEVYRKEGALGKTVKIATITDGEGEAFIDKTIKSGTSYRYQVLPLVLNEKQELEEGKISDSVTVKTSGKLKTPKINAHAKGKKLIIAFQSAEGEKYQIQFRWLNEKKWKSLPKMQGVINKKIAIRMNAKGFMIRVRSYSVVDGRKIYSTWSSPKKVK